MRGRRIIKAPSQQAMYVIAGLPKARHAEAINALERRYPQAIFKGLASPNQDGRLYSQALVEALIRSVGEFALRRRGNDPAQPTPASLTLLFVPSPDQEVLLQAFDFAVMAAPLPALLARDDQGVQLRHDREAVLSALVEALRPSSDPQMALNEVKRRLGYQSDNEALLLPPRNFLTEDGDLAPVFRSFRDGERAWTDRLEAFGPTPLGHEDVPSRIRRQQTRRPFVDQRGMAYFMAHPAAFDGAVREVGEPKDTGALQEALRSLYRFGSALPQGLHHDAQRSDGSALGGALLHCSVKGAIRGQSGYANVYPNDFVRVEKYEQAE